MKKYIISGILSMALTACGGPKDEKLTNEVTNHTQQQDSSTNDGPKSQLPFSKFYYKVDSCSQTNPYYKFVSVEDILMPVYLNGKQMIASIQIYLNADGSYYYEYEERQVMYRLPDGYGYNVVLTASFSGRWKTRGTILVLEQLGEAQETVYNGTPALKLFLNSNIREGTGLKEYAALARLTFSSIAKKLAKNICE